MDPTEYFLPSNQGNRIQEGLSILLLSENLDLLDGQITKEEMPVEVTDLKYIENWRTMMQTPYESVSEED